MAEPGALIGPYRLLSLLGQGAMGDVWRARDERLDRYVAIKLLPPDLAADPERRARMLREARAAAAVPHPHVVTLYDIVSEGERDVLVMELVDGHTLSETLRRGGPPPLREALTWLIAIADALATAHGRGILHRDIKSANMMVTPQRTIKVLDFGLAKLRDDATTSVAPAARVMPATSRERAAVALDATMASTGEVTHDDVGAVTGSGGDAYQTRAGALLGTPMYMAPEQIEGQRPDERSEVFSVGVVAFEVLAGQTPYSARSIDELFQQIVAAPPPPWPDGVPEPVRAVVSAALARDPAARPATMAALRDQLAAVRDAMFAPSRRRWPLAVALIAGAVAAALITWSLVRSDKRADRPGDAQVRRALDEYDLFYGDKALSSLRTALRVAPEHPRAHAYLVLFGGAADPELDAATAALERIVPKASGKDAALVTTAIALRRDGPIAARRALLDAGASRDRELAFWAAELAYRAGQYAPARAEMAALVDAPDASFRGRLYDHYSSLLLWADDPHEAVRIGKLYYDKFPGEADGAGVYATTLAIAGRLDEAITFAEEALTLAEGEDTLAGLGKVLALRGERARARDLYRRAVERAPDRRRPIRRAALALLQWIDGDTEGARATVAPCLPGGTDAAIPQRGQCLWVAGIVDPSRAPDASRELDALAAAATELAPAYGDPAALATLLRAQQEFAGGGCLVAAPPPPAPPSDRAIAAVEAAAATAPDFYAAYHLPFFTSWATCEHAALAAARGDRRRAAELLAPVAERAPDRAWLLDDLARYRAP